MIQRGNCLRDITSQARTSKNTREFKFACIFFFFLINTIYHVLLCNLRRRGGDALVRVALLAFLAHRGMRREPQWLSRWLTRVLSASRSHYSRLIIVSTSGEERYTGECGSVSLRTLPFDFRTAFPAVTRAFYRRFSKAAASP